MTCFSTQHLMTVFSDEDKYKNFKKLMFELAHGNDVYEYDDEGVAHKVSKASANKAIRKVVMQILDLSEEDLKSRKKRKRAIKAHGTELFEVIQEELEFKISQGFQENEWFNTFVDEHNLALGDGVEFQIEDTSYFVVCNYSGDNHDITMQQAPETRVISVNTTPSVIKIGKDIDLITLGRIDFTKWIDKVASSFVAYAQGLVYNAVYGAASKLPAQFAVTGSLDKDKFDTLIEDVATVNASDVIIVGTKTALKKINSFYGGSGVAIDWISDSQKESVANTGRLGIYEGTELMEVPQRFAINDTTTKLVDNNVLLVLPKTEDKFVKFVDEGETEILEETDKGDNIDDFQTYEICRRLGVEVVLGQYFGCYTIE